MVAGDYVARNLKALAMGGRLVHVASQAGHRVEISLAPIMAKGAYVTGSRLRPRSIEDKAQIAETAGTHRLASAREWPYQTDHRFNIFAQRRARRA